MPKLKLAARLEKPEDDVLFWESLLYDYYFDGLFFAIVFETVDYNWPRFKSL